MVKVESTHEFDGLTIEHLSWQLPAGPRTEAVFLKPIGAKQPLPAILALHDHGGNKFLGWRKIARIDDDPPPIIAMHQERYYGGVAWANELAKRGYAVLIHDTFPFASRRVRTADVPQRIRQDGLDPQSDDAEEVRRYNAFAGAHEHIMEKSLLSAGTTWPGVYVVEDQRALDVLCARPEILETSDLHAYVVVFDYFRLEAVPSLWLGRTETVIACDLVDFQNSVLLDNGDTIQGFEL